MSAIFASPVQATSTNANSGDGTVVYEKVDMVKNSVAFTDTFEITQGGMYQATLTDFAFPNPFSDSGLNITTSTDTLATLSGPGKVTFDASAGSYFVSLFAIVDGSGAGSSSKQQLFDEAKQAQHEKRLSSMSEEEIAAMEQSWNALSDEEKQARRDANDKRIEQIVDTKYCGDPAYGQYGIKIERIDDGETAVPVPTAFWLMGSGILGMVAVGRRSARRGSGDVRH